MTSNIGSHFILEHAGGDREMVEAQVMAALRQHFRPEFLNRVDDIIIFRPLGREEIEHIVGLQLGHLDKLLADRKLTLELTPEARRLIAEEGYDPAFGARPLKRAVQRLLQNPLALAILAGKFHEGDTIRATVGAGGRIAFERGEGSASRSDAERSEPAGAR